MRKCLDPDPTRRYQQGDHLADDLRRFLDDRPLKYAPELSRVEQVRKFFRRHPRLIDIGSRPRGGDGGPRWTVGAALIGARSHLAEASARLGKAQAEERKRAHDAGAVRALCLVNTILGPLDHLRQGIAVCEQTLALYQPPGWAALRRASGLEQPGGGGSPPARRRPSRAPPPPGGRPRHASPGAIGRHWSARSRCSTRPTRSPA